jgi:hypothetical protein
VFAAAASRAAAAPAELGHPVMREFPPGKSKINHLCQAVIQADDGAILLANGISACEYDGAAWRKIALPTECAGLRQFARIADGTVFAGGAGGIGFFRAAGLEHEFVSLADRLPPSATGCDEISAVLADGDTVYFADAEKILAWRDGRFALTPLGAPARATAARLHLAAGIVYVTGVGRPLARLDHGELIPVADDAAWPGDELLLVEPVAEGADGALRVLTAGRGFFLVSPDGRVAPLAAEANRWLAGKKILRAARAPDGALAVAFTSVSGDGGMRFAADGTYAGALDQSVGLYVKTLRALFFDREGGLWLGTETGLIRLEWPSALTLFDSVNGLGTGAVADVARHDGTLYAATGEGVFVLHPADADAGDGRAARFERLLAAPAYALVSHPGGLLALGYEEVFAQTPSGFAAIAKIPPGGGALRRSHRDPARVWIEATDGLRAVHFTADGWRDEGLARNVAGALPEPPAAAEPMPPNLPGLATDSAGAITRVLTERSAAGTVRWIAGAKALVRLDASHPWPRPHRGPRASSPPACAAASGSRPPTRR